MNILYYYQLKLQTFSSEKQYNCHRKVAHFIGNKCRIFEGVAIVNKYDELQQNREQAAYFKIWTIGIVILWRWKLLTCQFLGFLLFFTYRLWFFHLHVVSDWTFCDKFFCLLFLQPDIQNYELKTFKADLKKSNFQRNCSLYYTQIVIPYLKK